MSRLRAEVEELRRQQCTASNAANNSSSLVRQTAFALGGSTSLDSSQTGMILIHFSDLGDSRQSLRSPFTTRNDILNRTSPSLSEDDDTLTQAHKVKRVQYWMDLFNFEDRDDWLAFRVNHRRALLMISVL